MSVEHGNLSGRSRSSMDIPGKAAELEIEEEEYRSLLRLFTKNAAVELAQLEAAIRSDDRAEVARLAHSLKGVSANLGLAELFAIADSLDESARSGILGGAETGLALLRNEIDLISESITGGRS